MDRFAANSYNTSDITPQPEEKLIEQADPLVLSESDDELIKIAKQRIEADKSFYTKIHLKYRQDRNFKALFARRSDNFTDLYKRVQYNDNILYEIESSLKPLATSKDPDILVYPGSDNPESVATAEELTKGLQVAINTRELKEIKGIAFKHLPVYFIGALKYRWNPELGKNGDYEFLLVHPQNLVIDHNAKSRDVEDMEQITEYQEVSIQELIMRFPEKKEELFALLSIQKKLPEGGSYSQSQLATKLKIAEVWFNYYEKKEEGFTKISAVMWMYDSIVFKKMKNPNWDWQGDTHYFSYKDEIKPQQVMESFETGEEIPGFESEKVYYNYFDNPEFPYIFIGYDQWGTMAYDETTRIEQLVRLQEILDDRGDQIRRMLNRAMGKHIFSTEANLKAEDLEDMNWEDMDQAILVDGNVNASHKFIASEQPSAQMVGEYNSIRQISFQKAHVNAITGAIQSNTATSNQIAREANFTYADDLVDATINYMSEKIARAIMQMIKLRYTEDHFVRMIGAQGKMTFQRLHRDMIEDGMEVTITASATDKLQAENRAMEMAKMQLIDPLSFYEDIGSKNPDERAKRLMMFLNDPNGYTNEFIYGNTDVAQMDEKLNGSGQVQAQTDIQMIMQGQIPQLPPAVDEAYAQAILAFLDSPEFQTLPPQMQALAMDFAAQVAASLEQMGQAQSQQAPSQFGQAGGGGGQPNLNPQQPTPTNTMQAPVNPPTGAPQGSPRGI